MLNDLLKKWRKESGMTLEELAKKTNMSPQCISLYENKKRTIQIDTMQIFAKVFNKKIEIKEKEIPLIPTTVEQLAKIKNICMNTINTKEKRELLKDLFDITEEEINVGKLFDDMDEIEYIRNSPSKVMYTETGEIISVNIHSEEVILYYRCLGGEYTKTEVNTTCTIPPNSNPFIPPRRTSKAGFITEQRREMLKLLKESIAIQSEKRSIFDFKKFKETFGF